MRKFVATILTALLGIGTLTPAAMARANEKAAHNVAIGATAAAAYLLLHHKTRTAGILAAGGAAYAWKKHHDAVKQRHQIENRRAYGYGSSYYSNGHRYYRSSRYSRPTRSSYRYSRTARRYVRR